MAADVTDLLRELGCHQTPQMVEDTAGTALSPVDPAEVADSLAYAMRFDELGRAQRPGVEYAFQLAADQLMHQLTASGFIVMRRRPIAGHQ